jgi:chromosome partitioning protein
MPEHGSPAQPHVHDSASRQPSDGRPRVIALINQKGGVGKTTTTVNLGAALALEGKRVLVIDLDPQAHATLHLGIEQAGIQLSSYDLLLDPESDATACIQSINANLAVIPSETDLAAAESELATETDRHQRLREVLGRIGAAFDYVLIDCPPSLGVLTVNALAASQEVLIPMQAHFLALQGVGKLMETVGLVAAGVNPSLTVAGVVLCMHDASATLSQEVVADIEAYFDAARSQNLPWSSARVFRPPVRRNIKLAECPSFGKSIFDYAPTASGAADYRALARAILSPAAPDAVPTVVVTRTDTVEAAG